MNIRERIIAILAENLERPLAAEEIAERLALQGDELVDFWRDLPRLEKEAVLIRTNKGRYQLPAQMNMVAGRLTVNAKGFGFVILDKAEGENTPDIYIAADRMSNAMHNDRVLVQQTSGNARQGKAREGTIVRVLERANRNVVGRFEKGRRYGFVIPDDTRIAQDVFVKPKHDAGARHGDKVVLEITKWPEAGRSAEGKIVEILGGQDDAGVEILSIIKQHGLPLDFPPEVKEAAEQVPAVIDEADIHGRRDLRALPLVTIDGDDAKDLDDAVYVEPLAGGRYVLGVHIADVSHYVRENSVLDREARARGTSVYLVDRVLPMLPPRLSNGICSLNAGEDRLALSIHMEIDTRGRVHRYEIFPSVIRVQKRLTYQLVTKILVEQDEVLKNEYAAYLPMLDSMKELCGILRERRMRRGAIDFDFPEIKVKLDPDGKPLALVKRVRTLSESIIEEFMLAANEAVAEHLHVHGIPSLYRVHEEPEAEKMIKLDTLLRTFGQSLKKIEDIKPAALQKVLKRIEGQPEERIISTIMLRSLKQARYEAENRGHFGLAAEYYTHFTSPIRRYPDLIVHRMLRESRFTGMSLSAKRIERLQSMLPEIALNSSERERSAAEAERDTVELKKIEYMLQFLNEEFTGIISSVTAFGFFVELDNGVEGLVHVTNLTDDYYQYVEEQYALIGERTRNIYRIGDTVTVKLVKIDTVEKTLDFVLTGMEQPRPVRTVPKKRPTAQRDKTDKRKREPRQAKRSKKTQTNKRKTRK